MRSPFVQDKGGFSFLTPGLAVVWWIQPDPIATRSLTGLDPDGTSRKFQDLREIEVS